MELKDFIKNVLVDISTAIEESQDVLSQKACVAPLVTGGNCTSGIRTSNGYAKISDIDFDVAVTTESKDGTSSEAKGGIKVLDVINLGGGAKDERHNLSQSVSRVRFSIPIVYPHSAPSFQVNTQLTPPKRPQYEQ